MGEEELEGLVKFLLEFPLEGVAHILIFGSHIINEHVVSSLHLDSFTVLILIIRDLIEAKVVSHSSSSMLHKFNIPVVAQTSRSCLGSVIHDRNLLLDSTLEVGLIEVSDYKG
jgi:hypothetical protein